MNIRSALEKISNKEDLSYEEMGFVMNQLLSGELSDSQIGALIIALSIKGESVDEITASASVMRELSTKIEVVNKDLLLDTCGTGGVSSNIFNVSTASAFLAASCGVRIAKHGNRSVTSNSGSADLLEIAGVNINLHPSLIEECINKIGIGFMYAPSHHSAMKYAIGPRKEIGLKTIFNVLGPLTNPAGALNQVIGVYSKDLVRPIAEVLRSLGSERVMVVHSKDGLDEISIAKNTYIAELKDNNIKEYEINPRELGFNFSSLDSLKVNSPEESLKLVKEGLQGINKEASAMIVLNAGAGIYLVGLSKSLEEGIKMAEEGIRLKGGLKKLNELVSLSKELGAL